MRLPSDLVGARGGQMLADVPDDNASLGTFSGRGEVLLLHGAREQAALGGLGPPRPGPGPQGAFPLDTGAAGPTLFGSISGETTSLAGEAPSQGTRARVHRSGARVESKDHPAVKIKIRNSASKRAKKTGFRTRQKTVGGRKVNSRQRKRHGSI